MHTKPRSFLTAAWRNLVMLNYETDPDLLAPYVPRGTELDFWNGQTFLSLVGFQFLSTRVWGIPIPFHRNFVEVNLRFYVKRATHDGERRGVVFIKEIAPRRAVVWIARRFYNENYVALPMRHEVTTPCDQTDTCGRACYEWRSHGRWGRLAANFRGEPTLPAPDTLEHFIVEHYWAYSVQPDGTAAEYLVEHPPWRTWPAEDPEFTCDVATLYGSRFHHLLDPPFSALIADGSPVIVRRGQPVKQTLSPLPSESFAGQVLRTR